MKIQNLPLDQIKPYWRNPRINDSAVDAVKQSINDYGFNSPIVLDSSYVIIAGHTRYKALQQLNWKTVPCVIIDIDPAKAKEYRIADNKTSELSKWDMTALIPELREIEDLGSMQIYFDDFDIDALLKKTATVEDITADDMQKSADLMDTKYKEFSETSQNKYVQLACPKCGELFFVDRDELNRQPAQEKPE